MWFHLKKRILFVAAAAIIAMLPAGAAEAEEQHSASILLDGYPLPFPVEPAIIEGTTMVPFRAISEALGIQVTWNASSRTITAVDLQAAEANTVVLTLDDSIAAVNGTEVELQVAPMIRNDSTLIPLRFFSQQFGADVSWDGAAKTVSIRSPQRDMYTLAFYAISSFREVQHVPSFDAVAFGWSRIDQDGGFTLEGKDFYWPEPAGETTPASIVQSSKSEGTTPYLMVFASDGEGELTEIVSDETKREETIRSIIQTAAEGSFEGVLLDFEGLGLTGDASSVQAQFNEYVALLSEQTRARGLKLALSLHPLNGAYQGYDYKTLGNLADELIIMAYAYEGEKAPEPVHRVDEAIRLALQEVPPQKLVLGISMGSENAASLHVKIGLAKRYGLKGIAMWRLGLIGEAAYEAMGASLELKEP